MPPAHRRSIFADRLKPYADFAFGDDAVSARRGRWAAFFRDRIGPTFDDHVVLEIGCADGDFLARLAARHPATAFIGLDWKFKSLFLAAERVAAVGLRNVALLRGRGQDLSKMVGPGELDEMLLLHPDPFAEPDELPNRLFAEPFLIDAYTALRDQTGLLTLKTDHPGYYAWALALFGIDEPAHFVAARAIAAVDPSLANLLRGDPRVRAKDLLPPSNRLPVSTSATQRFEVVADSFDFWRDPDAQRHTAERVFADERSFFEQRFMRKRQPIYYLDLRKRPPTSSVAPT